VGSVSFITAHHFRYMETTELFRISLQKSKLIEESITESERVEFDKTVVKFIVQTLEDLVKLVVAPQNNALIEVYEPNIWSALSRLELNAVDDNKRYLRDGTSYQSL
jgi:hypothetical protein